MGKSPGELLTEELDLAISDKQNEKPTPLRRGIIAGLGQAKSIVNWHFYTLMGTEKYLSHLDLGQLERAIDIAQELIDSKRSEDKIPLWVVRDDISNLGFFMPDDYPAALQCYQTELTKKINEIAETPDKKNLKRLNLQISTHSVVESEIELFLEINTNLGEDKNGKTIR